MLATSDVFSLDSLPIEVLQLICEHLDTVLDFALVNKRCRSAANARLYNKIEITFSNPDNLKTDSNVWIDRLARTNSFHLVRELILKVPRPEPVLSNRLPDPADGELYPKWQSASERGFLSKLYGEQDWQPFANLVCHLPGLVELHYSCRSQLALCILSAIESRRACRLFLNTFHLRTLFQSPLAPISIHQSDLRLATSPCLYSVVSTRYNKYDHFSNIDFLEEATKTMTSGLAPNLREVSLCCERAAKHPGPGYYRNMPQVKWQGHELGKKPPGFIRGNLRCLDLSGSDLCAVAMLREWKQVTDFSKLEELKLRGNIDASVLAWLRTEVSFKVLQLLQLDVELEQNVLDAEAEETFTGNLLVEFVQRLPPLHTFQISGSCSGEAMDKILEIHGPTLQKLSWFVDDRYHDPRFAQLHSVRARWECLPLKDLFLPVYRTNGDKREVRQYQWLGRAFPNLRRLFLLVDCSDLGPELSTADRARHRGPGLHRTQTGTTYNLRYTIRNHAIDATLTEAIYRKISSSKPRGSPRLERLELRTKYGYASTMYPQDFWKLRRYVLGKCWVCTPHPRDDRPDDLVTKEVNVPDYDRAAHTEIDQASIDLFHSIWPEQPGRDWRECWHSFPLHGK